jgi:hypothetical protein
VPYIWRHWREIQEIIQVGIELEILIAPPITFPNGTLQLVHNGYIRKIRALFFYMGRADDDNYPMDLRPTILTNLFLIAILKKQAQ